MKKAALILLHIFVITIIGTVSAQEKETFTDRTAHFVIKIKNVQSQKYADHIIKEESKSDKKREWAGEVPPGTPPPPVSPPPAVFEDEAVLHFVVWPDKYIRYMMSVTDTIVGPVNNIIKIDRETFSVKKFVPFRFELCENESPKGYGNDGDYSIIETNKDNAREICGYNCYQVILQNNDFPERRAELYVTEKISLNYHPVFNYKKYLDQYYPLYVKEYDVEFPDDMYKECVFYINW